MNKKLIFVLSVGRSGSTWFAKVLSRELGALNMGENRFFWERVFSSGNVSERKQKIESFVLRKSGEGYSVFVDKSTNLYKYVDQLSSLGVDFSVVVLRRNAEDISDSKVRFAPNIFRLDRIAMRVKKYWRDYGLLFFVPIMQRWRFLLIPFGGSVDKAFSTQSFSEKKSEDEVEFFERCLKGREECLLVDYDNFGESVSNLKSLGLSLESLDRIRSEFKG